MLICSIRWTKRRKSNSKGSKPWLLGGRVKWFNKYWAMKKRIRSRKRFRELKNLMRRKKESRKRRNYRRRKRRKKWRSKRSRIWVLNRKGRCLKNSLVWKREILKNSNPTKPLKSFKRRIFKSSGFLSLQLRHHVLQLELDFQKIMIRKRWWLLRLNQVKWLQDH